MSALPAAKRGVYNRGLLNSPYLSLFAPIVIYVHLYNCNIIVLFFLSPHKKKEKKRESSKKVQIMIYLKNTCTQWNFNTVHTEELLLFNPLNSIFPPCCFTHKGKLGYFLPGKFDENESKCSYVRYKMNFALQILPKTSLSYLLYILNRSKWFLRVNLII